MRLGRALLLLLAAAGPALAGGDDGSLEASGAKHYFPLEQDVRWRYAVRPRGRATVTNALGEHKIDGKKYVKQTVVIALPGSRAAPETNYLRHTDAGLMQYDSKAKKEEVLVPYPLKPGQKWTTTTGGNESQRTYVGMFTYTVAGIEWPDVIKIVADSGTRKLEMFYAKDVGLIETISRTDRRTISLRSEISEIVGGKAGKIWEKKAHAWRPYICTAGGYQIDMPGSPVTRTTRVRIGKTSVHAEQAVVKRSAVSAFYAYHYALPASLKKPTSHAVLDSAAEAALKVIGGRVDKKRIKSTRHDHGGEAFKGRELKATVQRSGNELQVVIRVLHSESRGFMLITCGTKKELPKKDSRKFLRSLSPLP